MNDKGSQLFFVTKSGLGFEEGVITQEEFKSLPGSARPHVITIGVAESMGYVVLDHKSGNDINQLDVYAGIDPETKKQRKLRNVKEGTFGTPSIPETPISQKIGNSLRTSIQEIKHSATENSLKAQIEKKKLELTKSAE